ncbi:MAG: cell division protein FtsL [Burkholderiales bacterium]|nr:cell division protein FtsL [Burkholderiales bacterium]MDE2454434.1 cell division protein FtsL [Burkholderiales bacterium]
MMKLNLVLLAALVLSSLALVRSAYDERRLFAAIDRARNEGQQLEVDAKRLEAEREAQATHLRVESVARQKLQMRNATPAITEYVVDDPASGAAR